MFNTGAGLWQYFCLSTDCIDTLKNEISPDFKILILKPEAKVGDTWTSTRGLSQLEKVLDEISFSNGVSPRAYRDVLVIKRTSPPDGALYTSPTVGEGVGPVPSVISGSAASKNLILL